jgi:HEAT repeat protein
MAKPEETLSALFDAERALRSAEQSFMQNDPEALAVVLVQAVSDAKALSDLPESRMRLERLADLCAQVPGPEMTDALIEILDDSWTAVRVQAAEALVDVGYERYAEVARGAERALATEQFMAQQELPWVLVELGEPSARKLIVRFLASANADVAASAIEALAELGDPGSIKDLKPFVGDVREVEIESDEGGEAVTLGELASEAIDTLGGD